jgi:hypothetical protein
MTRYLLLAMVGVSLSSLAQPKVVARCDKPQSHSCTDFLAAPSDKAIKLCESTRGTFTRGASCDLKDVVGSCEAANPEKTPLRTHYLKGTSVKDPAELCRTTLKGTWTAR